MPEPPSTIAIDAPAGSLKRLALQGVMWTMTGFGGSQLLRFAFNLILTRLLYPELFGLMALVFTIVTGLNLFSDAGISTSIVRDPRGDDPKFLNTAWTLQIVRGLGLTCFCFLIAWPAAAFYADRRLRWVLPAIGLTNLFGAFNSTSLLTLRRQMAVRPQMIVDLGTQLLSGVVTIVWAWLSPGAVALVAGALLSSVTRMVWSHFLIPGTKNRIAWEPAAAQSLFKFGRWIWIASMLTFLATQIDRLILGKMLALQVLGIYSLALTIADVPRGLALSIKTNVIFPAYSMARELARPDLRARILRHRWPFLVMMACAVVVPTSVGDILMRLLYDKRYAEGAWMLPVLALGMWPSILAHTIDTSLFVVGKPRYAATGNFLKLLFTALGIPLGYRLAGVAGAVIVVGLNDLPYYGQIVFGLHREGLNSMAQDLKATALLLAILLLTLAARYAMGWGFPIHGMF